MSSPIRLTNSLSKSELPKEPTLTAIDSNYCLPANEKIQNLFLSLPDQEAYNSITFPIIPELATAVWKIKGSQDVFLFYKVNESCLSVIRPKGNEYELLEYPIIENQIYSPNSYPKNSIAVSRELVEFSRALPGVEADITSPTLKLYELLTMYSLRGLTTTTGVIDEFLSSLRDQLKLEIKLPNTFNEKCIWYSKMESPQLAFTVTLGGIKYLLFLYSTPEKNGITINTFKVDPMQNVQLMSCVTVDDIKQVEQFITNLDVTAKLLLTLLSSKELPHCVEMQPTVLTQQLEMLMNRVSASEFYTSYIKDDKAIFLSPISVHLPAFYALNFVVTDTNNQRFIITLNIDHDKGQSLVYMFSIDMSVKQQLFLDIAQLKDLIKGRGCFAAHLLESYCEGSRAKKRKPPSFQDFIGSLKLPAADPAIQNSFNECYFAQVEQILKNPLPRDIQQRCFLTKFFDDKLALFEIKKIESGWMVLMLVEDDLGANEVRLEINQLREVEMRTECDISLEEVHQIVRQLMLDTPNQRPSPESLLRSEASKTLEQQQKTGSNHTSPFQELLGSLPELDIPTENMQTAFQICAYGEIGDEIPLLAQDLQFRSTLAKDGENKFAFFQSIKTNYGWQVHTIVETEKGKLYQETAFINPQGLVYKKGGSEKTFQDIKRFFDQSFPEKRGRGPSSAKVTASNHETKDFPQNAPVNDTKQSELSQLKNFFAKVTVIVQVSQNARIALNEFSGVPQIQFKCKKHNSEEIAVIASMSENCFKQLPVTSETSKGFENKFTLVEPFLLCDPTKVNLSIHDKPDLNTWEADLVLIKNNQIQQHIASFRMMKKPAEQKEDFALFFDHCEETDFGIKKEFWKLDFYR